MRGLVGGSGNNHPEDGGANPSKPRKEFMTKIKKPAWCPNPGVGKTGRLKPSLTRSEVVAAIGKKKGFKVVEVKGALAEPSYEPQSFDESPGFRKAVNDWLIFARGVDL